MRHGKGFSKSADKQVDGIRFIGKSGSCRYPANSVEHGGDAAFVRAVRLGCAVGAAKGIAERSCSIESGSDAIAGGEWVILGRQRYTDEYEFRVFAVAVAVRTGWVKHGGISGSNCS